MSEKTRNEYVPFGKEWEREMEKFTKARLIQWVREQAQELQKMRAIKSGAKRLYDMLVKAHTMLLVCDWPDGTDTDGVATLMQEIGATLDATGSGVAE